MLATLLSAQFGKLTLSVGPERMRAQGIGVDVERSYRVLWATGNQSSVRLFDESGASYDVALTIDQGALLFSSRTSPWRGTGRMQRAP
jgi:hypothetical protein